MRQVISPQLRLGELDIAAIALNPKSRDDIPQLLRGLQYIYVTPAVRERIFAILEEIVPEGIDGQADTGTGRPGMDQWKILVLGALRLGLNTDYDRLHELANEHKTIRALIIKPATPRYAATGIREGWLGGHGRRRAGRGGSGTC